MNDPCVDEVICATDAGREGECISDMCTSFADARSLSRDFGFLQLKKMIL
mgnify:CR=1 FL=1